MARNVSVERRARVVVAGAGFAGASLLRHLPPPLRRRGETLLIDRAHEYTFVPLIHEVAVGRVHPDSVRSPIAPLCRDACDFLQTEITGLDLANKTLDTRVGRIGYEYLVLNPGSVAAPAPSGLRDHLQSFWSLDDALRLRGTLARAWNAATSPGESPRGVLTVAVVGGGTTGVELAAEVAALFDYLRKRSHREPSERPRIVLLEATDRLMSWLDPYFDRVARKALADLGVEVRLNASVEETSPEGVRTSQGWLRALTRVWTAGVESPPLVRDLPGEHDRMGRSFVDEHLCLPGHPEVYVLGDAAMYS
ncbi:MAG: NAD(P)/FAD-dependent oxidoreductase, partial [Rubrobacter sp.]